MKLKIVNCSPLLVSAIYERDNDRKLAKGYVQDLESNTTASGKEHKFKTYIIFCNKAFEKYPKIGDVIKMTQVSVYSETLKRIEDGKEIVIRANYYYCSDFYKCAVDIEQIDKVDINAVANVMNIYGTQERKKRNTDIYRYLQDIKSKEEYEYDEQEENDEEEY